MLTALWTLNLLSGQFGWECRQWLLNSSNLGQYICALWRVQNSKAVLLRDSSQRSRLTVRSPPAHLLHLSPVTIYFYGLCTPGCRLDPLLLSCLLCWWWFLFVPLFVCFGGFCLFVCCLVLVTWETDFKFWATLCLAFSDQLHFVPKP